MIGWKLASAVLDAVVTGWILRRLNPSLAAGRGTDTSLRARMLDDGICVSAFHQTGLDTVFCIVRGFRKEKFGMSRDMYSAGRMLVIGSLGSM